MKFILDLLERWGRRGTRGQLDSQDQLEMPQIQVRLATLDRQALQVHKV